MHRHCHSEASLRLGRVALVCCLAALQASEEFLLFLGRKALNLRMAKSARPGASRADVIGSPSTWATRGVWPTLLSLPRLPPRPHPGLFPFADSQARPRMLFPKHSAGSPRIHWLGGRCHSDLPARRLAGACGVACPNEVGQARTPGR